MPRKVEVDLDVHAEKLRAYENAKERHRIANNRVRNLEGELASARYNRDECAGKLAAAESAVATSMLEALLPELNASQEAAAEPCAMSTSGNGQGGLEK